MIPRTHPVLSGPGIVVADGGLATELERRGNDLSDPLWSARLLVDSPAEVVAAHAAYFRAGARIATTASYQASFTGFAARGLGFDDTAALLRRSVELADAARQEVAGDGGQRWIAASVGPYGAVLADGSEYRGRYGKTVAELRAWHRPRLEVLAGSGADLLAVETVPDVDEAEALVDLVRELGVPAWVSYTVDGDRTRAGQPLDEAFAVVDGVDEVIAVGVNCCRPQDVPGAIRTARRVVDKPVVVYPNSGEDWTGTWTGAARFDAAAARGWAADGASVIGGCCRVGPELIAGVADLLRAERPG
ncbi:homocysteine S-methyltransferase [Actinokineospora spheciospongiae]|uniref:homocysteine S-methyltransferase n=1 Tax=Actinokineospora spheciospongiae TaxID=909613 RepID=UPI001F3DE3AD|nr:homocysteine S-methyltransferase [Actinokineospora spheciospongiae]